jgi:hypothetical protein
MSGECKCGGQCKECFCERRAKDREMWEKLRRGVLRMEEFLDVEHEGLEKEGGGR